MKPEETLDYHIKTTWHAISRMYNQQAVKHGITTAIGFVLLNIDVKDGTPATKIAPLMGLESRSLTRILKSIEESGLIYKLPDEHDKRSVRIFLTKKGLEKQAISKKVVRTFNEKLMEAIPQKKQNVFFEVMNQINDLINGQKIYDETIDFSKPRTSKSHE